MGSKAEHLLDPLDEVSVIERSIGAAASWDQDDVKDRGSFKTVLDLCRYILRGCDSLSILGHKGDSHYFLEPYPLERPSNVQQLKSREEQDSKREGFVVPSREDSSRIRRGGMGGASQGGSSIVVGVRHSHWRRQGRA